MARLALLLACCAAWCACGLDIRLMLPLEYPVVIGNQVELEFRTNSSIQELFSDDSLSSVPVFEIETTDEEFYYAPKLTCKGCQGLATPELDQTTGSPGLNGNLDKEIFDDDFEFEGMNVQQLRVMYNCQKPSDVPLRLTLTFTLARMTPISAPAEANPEPPMDDEDDDFFDGGDLLVENRMFNATGTLAFTWLKTCTGGKHTGIGVLYGDIDVVANGVALEDWSPENPSFVIPATEDEIAFQLFAYDGSFVYNAAKPDVIGAGYSVKAAGNAASGGFALSLDGEFDTHDLILLMEKCDTTASGFIRITWTLPPYDPVSFAFKKECPKEHPFTKLPLAGFTVAIDTPHARPIVVSDGVNQDTESTIYLGPATDYATLWLVSTRTAVTLENMIVSQAPVTLFTHDVRGASFPFEVPNTPAPIGIKMACQKKGETRVTITLDVQGHRSNDIIFTKNCPSLAALKHKEKRSWGMSSVLFMTLLGASIIGCFAWCIREANRKGRPTKPVKQAPSAIDL